MEITPSTVTDDRQPMTAEKYRQKVARLKAAFARFASRMSDIRKRRNRLVSEITERQETEHIEQVRKSIDEQ